ncbi:MAG: hypothetical protein ACJ79E_16195 [Anaeromyxobacteraceae bacterium]
MPRTAAAEPTLVEIEVDFVPALFAAPRIAAEPAAASAREAPQPFTAPQEARAAATATRADAVHAAAPALPPPPADAGDVQGAVLRHSAHLRVDAGGLGALELHLRVRDGALHLRVDGEGARTVEARAGELSRALAGEGLRLASVEAPPQDGAHTGADGGRGHGERRDAWQEARDARDAPTPPQPRAATTPTPATARGVHVKA